MVLLNLYDIDIDNLQWKPETMETISVWKRKVVLVIDIL